MKEKKLRAWNKELGKMCDEGTLEDWLFQNQMCGYMMGELDTETKKDLLKPTKDYSHLIFLEYVGKKDKNGRDIFESDIIKCEGNITNWKTGTVLAVVEWIPQRCGFALKSKDFYQRSYSLHGVRNIEVVGNIYENPEAIVALSM